MLIAVDTPMSVDQKSENTKIAETFNSLLT